MLHVKRLSCTYQPEDSFILVYYPVYDKRVITSKYFMQLTVHLICSASLLKYKISGAKLNLWCWTSVKSFHIKVILYGAIVPALSSYKELIVFISSKESLSITVTDSNLLLFTEGDRRITSNRSDKVWRSYAVVSFAVKIEYNLR